MQAVATNWISPQVPDGHDWLGYMMSSKDSTTPLDHIDAHRLRACSTTFARRADIEAAVMTLIAAEHLSPRHNGPQMSSTADRQATSRPRRGRGWTDETSSRWSSRASSPSPRGGQRTDPALSRSFAGAFFQPQLCCGFFAAPSRSFAGVLRGAQPQLAGRSSRRSPNRWRSHTARLQRAVGQPRLHPCGFRYLSNQSTMRVFRRSGPRA